jgi:Domain of unknown function (DUF4271)
MKSPNQLYILFFLLLSSVLLSAQSSSTKPVLPKSNIKAVFSDSVKAKKDTSTTNSSTRAAAAAKNPFDVFRQDTPDVEVTATPTTGNPFDIYRSADPSGGQRTFQAVKKRIVIKPKTGNFRFTMLVMMLAYLMVLVGSSRSFLQKIYGGFLNDNLLRIQYRELSSVTLPGYLAFYALFIANISIFTYLVLDYLGNVGTDNRLEILFSCIFGIAIAFVLKHFILSLVGFVFPISKEVGLYAMTISVFNIILGLILAPMNLLVAYAPTTMTKNLLLLTVAMIALVYGYRIIRSLLIGLRFVGENLFHFLLYLCTMEIAPLMVIAKFIADKIGE